MADLKSMFGKKPQATQGVEDAQKNESSSHTTATRNKDTKLVVDAVIPSQGNPVAEQASANPFARKATSVPSETQQTEQAKPKLASFKVSNAVSDKARAEKTSDTQTASPSESLSDLDAIDLDSVNETRDTPTRSGFADETPAQAPIRELPEDLSTQQKNFVDLMNGVYEMIYDPELLGNVVKSLMQELKENPEFIKLVAPDDIRTWIRAMRESMGLARVKKQETKSKRSGSSSKSTKVDADMMSDLDSLLNVEL